MRLVSGAWSGTATFSVHLADSGNQVSTLNSARAAGLISWCATARALPRRRCAGGPLAPNTTYYLVAR